MERGTSHVPWIQVILVHVEDVNKFLASGLSCVNVLCMADAQHGKEAG